MDESIERSLRRRAMDCLARKPMTRHELGERLKDTGVTAAAVHPGWARSNLGRGGTFGQRVMLGVAMPMANAFGWTDSNEESAQTTLHVLLSDDGGEG